MLKVSVMTYIKGKGEVEASSMVVPFQPCNLSKVVDFIISSLTSLDPSSTIVISNEEETVI